MITDAFHEMVERLKGKVSGKDKKVIDDTTEKIVQATMEDVYLFDPKFQAITDTAFKRKPTIHYRKGHLWGRRSVTLQLRSDHLQKPRKTGDCNSG